MHATDSAASGEKEGARGGGGVDGEAFMILSPCHNIDYHIETNKSAAS